MSIHHIVTVHCDECGQWCGSTRAGTGREHVEGESARHRCPKCARTSVPPSSRAVTEGGK